MSKRGPKKGYKQTADHIEKRITALRGRKRGPESAETRAKKSRAHKGKKRSDAHRRACSEGQRGRVHSDETRAKIRESALGHRRNLGSKRSEESKAKMRAAWTPERRRKHSERMRDWMRKQGRGINKSEKKLLKLLRALGYPYEFVGDFSFTVEGKSPDFRCGGRLIELFGEGWHEPHEEQTRRVFFETRGYKCLVIWCNDLWTNPQKVVQLIREFHGNT